MPAEETTSEQTPQSLEQLPPSAQMFQYIISLMVPQAIHIAAKLGIADLVAKAPVTVEELAAATGSNAPSLRRLLKFLTSLGIFSEDGSEKYHQTPLSDTLRGNHPQSTRGFAIL
jgi:Dimerisation domain